MALNCPSATSAFPSLSGLSRRGLEQVRDLLLESRVPGPSYRWEFVDAAEVLPQQIERLPTGPSVFVENAWVGFRIDTIQNALLKRGTLVVRKSEGAVVRISKRSPAASRMQLLTSAAIPSRCETQLASSEDVSTTAVFGFATLALEKPSARHCARRRRQRGAGFEVAAERPRHFSRLPICLTNVTGGGAINQCG